MVFRVKEDLSKENSELIKQNRTKLVELESKVFPIGDESAVTMSIGVDWVSYNGRVVRVKDNSGVIENTGTNDSDFMLNIPLAPNKNGKKLYIKGYGLGLEDADGGSYLNDLKIREVTAYNTVNTLYNDTSNRTSPGDYTQTFTAVDCSSAEKVFVYLYHVWTHTAEYGLAYFNITYYYDD
jgi:hypothetical protein